MHYIQFGETCSESLCKDLHICGWLETEGFDGSKNWQMLKIWIFWRSCEDFYKQTNLWDLIYKNGRKIKSIQVRTNKVVGIINQLCQILDTLFCWKHYFEVALVLISSLLLSSLLLNSEAWVNLSDKDISALEQTDECLLAKILATGA